MHCSELDTCIEARCTVRNLTHDAGARGARGARGAWGWTTKRWRHRRRRRRRWTRGSRGRSAALRGARPGSQEGCSARAGQGKWQEWRGCPKVERLSKSGEAVAWRDRCTASSTCSAATARGPAPPGGGVSRAGRERRAAGCAEQRAGRRVAAPRRLTLEPFSGALRCRFQVQERTIEGAPGWPTAKRRREVRAVGPRTRRTPTRSRPCIPPGRAPRASARRRRRGARWRAAARGARARGSRSLRRRTAGARTRPRARSTCGASHMSVLRRHMGS